MDNLYARFEIAVSFGGERRLMEGMVSEHGVRRIFEVGAMPKYWDSLTGKTVDVELRGMSFKGVFTREILPDASFYNIRFNAGEESQLKRLKSEIEQFGFPAPWHRAFPRIYADVELKNVGLPTVALVETGEGVQFYKVINFTLGGVLIESEPETTVQMPLGHKFYFQLMISSGASISGIWGVVVRIDEESSRGRVSYRYGVQIASMSSLANKKYRTIILDYCEKVKELYRA
jgi:hypothetical protein